MAEQDKALLLQKVDGTLRTRMFANLLEEAENEIQDHLDGFEVEYIGSEKIESEDLLDAYLAAKKASGRTEKTLTRYRYVIQRFLKAVNVKTREVNADHIRSYLANERERGIQDSTLDGIRQVLYPYFDWLHKMNKIRFNPVAQVETIKTEKKERLAYSMTDIEIMKRQCNSDPVMRHPLRNNAIICFFLATGCRVSEVVGLNRDEVDLENGECTVHGKGRKERTVFLDDVAILALKEYLASRHDDNEALFLGYNMQRLKQSGIRAMLKHLAEKAGLENVHPHRFRRTTITRLLNRGMPIQEVAILAGHDKIETTMEYYSCTKDRIKNSYRLYSA